MSGSLIFVTGLSANATEVWAVTSNGHFLRATTGAFSEVTGNPFFTTAGIYVAPDGAVFTAQSYRLVRCSSGCATGANHLVTSYPNSEFVAVCGSSSSDVFFIGQDSPTRSVLVHWNGNALATLSTDLGLPSPRACYLAPDGALYIAGRRDVVRWEGGTAFVERPDLSGLGTATLTSEEGSGEVEWSGRRERPTFAHRFLGLGPGAPTPARSFHWRTSLSGASIIAARRLSGSSRRPTCSLRQEA